MKKLIAALLITLALSACAYHFPFSQGNVLTLSKVRSIHPGMSAQQVVGVLGAPVLKNMYANRRMTYVYTQQPTRNKTVVKKLLVNFRNGAVYDVRTGL